MFDAFAELDLPRSPVINPDDVAGRFDRLSRERHPDAGGETKSFARLTEARSMLTSPARRLRHLLELQFPGTPLAGLLSAEIMHLFAAIGPALHTAKQVLDRKAAAITPLSRALLATPEMESREVLESLATAVHARIETMEAAAARWDGSGKSLSALAREMAFLEKWQTQLRDSLQRLGM